MAVSEEARKNHDELFRGHVSTLKITDPELVEYFDNFAFDEVIRHGSLDTRTRLMVQLAALIACQALSEYFIHATNDILTERGIQLPLEGQSTTSPETRLEKGLAVQKEIVGADAVDHMYAAAADDEMCFQQFLTGNCFGDHYTRTGIDLKTRELLTFAMLVSLGGCEPQAKGHVAANLNVGNDRAVLISLITQLLPFLGYPRTLNALRVINEVTTA